MERKLYLGELLKKENIDIIDILQKTNILIVSPVGSGKTHYIMNELCNDKTKKYLYLCDNNNLKSQIMLENNCKNSKGQILDSDFKLTNEYFGKRNVTVMNYKEFGHKCKYDANNLINSYDIIVCDEVHNLIDYQNFSNDEDLSRAIDKLVCKYSETQIIWFTATPYHLRELCEKYIYMDEHFLCYDYSKNKEIKRYYNERRIKYNNGNQIPKILLQYDDGFNYCGNKALIYIQKINEMLSIEQELKKVGFKPICIWSINNINHPMTEEQLKVRKHLLQTGKLIEPYNILIINRSSETGINIKDEKFKYCIINTTNVTQQIQARGRLRDDINLLAELTIDAILPEIKLTVPNKWLNVDLTTEDKNEIVNYFNLKDEKGRIIKWTRLKKIIVNSGYIVTDKQVKINKKNTKVSNIEEDI